jgi:hypothetical protein
LRVTVLLYPRSFQIVAVGAISIRTSWPTTVKLFVEINLYTLHIFKWFKGLREGHEDLEDDARWVAISCPKSGNSCGGYKLLARDHQMIQKLMEVQLGSN